MKSLARKFAKPAQRGASLLESIAFLGVAAIVILGAVSLLLGSFSSANGNRAAQEISSIRTGVKKLYMGQAASFGSSNMNATLVASKVFPSTLSVDSSGNVSNAWNGAVSVDGATATFTISYGNVPGDACINLASVNGDWVGLTINGTALTMPASPAAATTACGASANAMVWTVN